jgi:hypothetical protein
MATIAKIPTIDKYLTHTIPSGSHRMFVLALPAQIGIRGAVLDVDENAQCV